MTAATVVASLDQKRRYVMGCERYLTSKHTPNAVFVGKRQDPSGAVVDMWIDQDRMLQDRRAEQELKHLAGKAGAGGVGGRTLGRIMDAHSKSLRRVESGDLFSRRLFLKAAAVAGVGGMLGCSDGGTGPTQEELTAVIEGPMEATIPGVGRASSIPLDSSACVGPVLQREWSREILGTDIEPTASVGDRVKLNYPATRPGEHVVTLTVHGGAPTASTTHTVKVNPPQLPGGTYNNLPLLYIARERVGDSVTRTIWSYDLETRKSARFFGSPIIYGSTVSWDPTGERLIFVWEAGNATRIATYNLLSGEFNRINTPPPGYNSDGFVWAPKVSPTGEWVAFLDDGRFIDPRRGYDEPALVRIDGTDQFYLCGEVAQPTFIGFALTWDPTGEMIALGDDDKRLERGVMIIGDLWSGAPSTEGYIPTEEQLQNLWVSEDWGIDLETFWQSVLAGAFGVAWSPDGKRIAYRLMFGWGDSLFYQLLAVSNIDGSGDIEVVARAGSQETLDYISYPTWSLDNETLFFMGQVDADQAVYRVVAPYQPELIVAPGSAPALFG
jgi:hypothetical protein